MSYTKRCPTCGGEGKMFYGQCKTCEGLGQVGVLFTDLIGLMGMCEMECTVATMLNLAQQSAKPFSELSIKPEDFKPLSSEAEGFRELVHYGWLQEKGGAFYPSRALVNKLRDRFDLTIR